MIWFAKLLLIKRYSNNILVDRLAVNTSLSEKNPTKVSQKRQVFRKQTEQIAVLTSKKNFEYYIGFYRCGHVSCIRKTEILIAN